MLSKERYFLFSFSRQGEGGEDRGLKDQSYLKKLTSPRILHANR